MAFDGQYLCRLVQGHITAYRLTALSSEAADFQRIGEYRPTILEKFFGSSYFGSFQMQNGLLFVSEQPSAELNPHISVFELRGPHPLTPVGHFGAPGISVACPLPDGRTLIGGNKLYLVGPPPRRG